MGDLLLGKGMGDWSGRLSSLILGKEGGGGMNLPGAPMKEGSMGRSRGEVPLNCLSAPATKALVVWFGSVVL